MKCGKCGAKLSYMVSTLQQLCPDRSYKVDVPGHGAVTICAICYDEFCTIPEVGKQEILRRIRMWFEGKSFESNYDEKRYCILSLSSGSMFDLMGEMVSVSSLEGVIGVRKKMVELRNEINEALNRKR